MFPRLGGLVGGLLLAAEHHHDPAVGIELDDHVRALVDGPDVVVGVDADGVGEGPRVKIAPNLAHELALGVEFQQLRRGRAICRSARASAGEHEHMAFGIDSDPSRFAEVQVGGKF